MRLDIVGQNFIDQAWKDGASCLSMACETSGGEITGDQLKMLLSRGERTLVRMFDEETVGWAAFRVDQLPNMRVFFITDLVAPRIGFQRFFEEAKRLATALGCSRVRCAAKPAQERLYRSRCGFKPVYQIMEVEL